MSYRIWLLIALLSLTGACLEKENDMVPYNFDEGLSNAIEKKNGWSATGDIRTPIPVGIAAGPPSPDVVSLQANFADDPGAYTVQFTVNIPADAGTAVRIRARAQIFWSVEGNEITRSMEVVDGGSISGVGQGVRVVVSDISRQVAPGAAPPSVTYSVSITVIKGVRPTSPNPPFLAPIAGDGNLVGHLTTAQESIIDVPLGVGVNSVAVFPFATDSVDPDASVPVILLDNEVEVYQSANDSTGGAPTVFDVLRMYDPRDVTWVPLAPGTRSIIIRNKSATAGTILWYSIAFGIDG